MVIGATCNCIPGDREGDAPSAFLNCQDYQLNEEQNLINTTILTQGQCDFEMFAEDLSSCSNLGNVTGVNVIGSVAIGELLNLTTHLLAVDIPVHSTWLMTIHTSDNPVCILSGSWRHSREIILSMM